MPENMHYLHNKVFVSSIDEQWQIDLADLYNLSMYNDGYKYLLNCIDVFSKYAWSIPLKSKQGTTVVEAFKTILDASGRKPHKIQADAGTAFKNKEFKKFIKDKVIDFLTTNSELKASVVERFNRTLKEKMCRYFTKNITYKYIDVLDDLLKNYNSSYHRTIKMEPINVTANDENDILNRT